MQEVFLISIIASFLGTIIGGIIGGILGKPNSKALGLLLAVSAGIMIGVTSFDIVPDAINNTGVILTSSYILLSVVIISFINLGINHLENKQNTTLPRLGIILLIALSLHNIPEGLLIGSLSIYDLGSGITMAIIMIIHDIPEGMIIASSFRKSNYSFIKSIIPVIVSGVFALIGSLIGIYYTLNNQSFVGIALSLASGAMLYISYSEIIPEAMKLSNKTLVVIMILLGLIISLFL